jgi:hypothetical protein
MNTHILKLTKQSLPLNRHCEGDEGARGNPLLKRSNVALLKEN